MVVNSIIFWLFFIVVLVVYYTGPRRSSRAQNAWLLAASCFFYGYISWKMLLLLGVVTVVFFFLGKGIAVYEEKDAARSSILKTAGVVLGVGVLFYFRYLGFFVGEVSKLIVSLGMGSHPVVLQIMMPVGVSFFTFRLISYVLDVYHSKCTASGDLVAFATYIAFFPTIMSGPIDRPGEFLLQLEKPRYFQYNSFAEGGRRIVWGMFMKMCIADRLAIYTDAVFNNYVHHNGTTLIIAAILYAFQLYTDFAGYSEMAIGVASMLGIKVRENFLRPFFTHNILEYWSRWHMSLTSWLTDYVFTPLCVRFRNWGSLGINLAMVLNMIVVGIWHGANWTFLVFGLYHAFLMVLVNVTNKRRKHFEKQHQLKNNVLYQGICIVITFVLVVLGDVIFRSDSISAFGGFLHQISLGMGAPWLKMESLALGGLFVVVLFLKELKDERGWNIHLLHAERPVVRLFSFAALVAAIVYCGVLNGGQFIYFQF